MAIYEVNEFHGGIKDEAWGCSKHQYTRAENLLIDDSKKLFLRPGSALLDDSHPRPLAQRISAIFNYAQDSAILAQSARKLFEYSAGWSELIGPSGNPALSSGDVNCQSQSSEWKGHLFLVNSEKPVPSMLYKNALGALQVRTAGLPRFVGKKFWLLSVVDSDIKTLANEIKLRMKDHFVDANVGHAQNRLNVYPTYTPDSVAYAAITLPDIQDGDSLDTVVALTKQLMVAYRLHRGDAIKGKDTRQFHPNLEDRSGIPNIGLSYDEDPETWTWMDVVQRLNDIRRKFNWHTRSFKGHYDPLYALVGGSQSVTVSAVLPDEDGPLFSSLNLSGLTTFANLVKTKFNEHLADNAVWGAHSTSYAFATENDVENVLRLADSTDKDSLIELIYHLYGAYSDHQADAVNPVYDFSGRMYADPAKKYFDNVKSLGTFGTTLPSGTLANVEPGMYVSTFDRPNIASATKVVSVDIPGQKINLDKQAALDALTDIPFFVSKMRYHLLTYAHKNQTWENDSKVGNLAYVDLSLLSANLSLLAQTLKDIADKFNSHDNNYGYTDDLGIHAVNGAHQVNADEYPTLLKTASDGTSKYSYSYNYAFVYYTKYKTEDGSEFEVRSAPLRKKYESFKKIEDAPNRIVYFPTIDNGSTLNYDTANIKIEIYRTTDAGLVEYKVGEVALGTPYFDDFMEDIEASGNLAIYTDGGVADNDPPPAAKFVHITNKNFAYYGNIVDTLASGKQEILPNRVRQSIANSPYSCPGDFYLDLPAPVAGISSVFEKPIVWTRDAVYRIEGFFDELGRGEMYAVPISKTIGLRASYSPVQIDGGVIFAGPDGFYYTDAYRVQKITNHWNYTYQSLVASATKEARISGVLDKVGNRVYYTVARDSSENDACFVLDLDYGIPAQQGAAFTTMSNGSHFAPTALAVYKDQLIRGDFRGYIFKHDPSYTSDPWIAQDGSIKANATKAVLWDYQSGTIDFETNQFKKWVTRIIACFNNGAGNGNLSAAIESNNDQGAIIKSLSSIRVRGVVGDIHEKRHFPSGTLRLMSKQIRLYSAKTVITKSDTLGLAASDTVTKTVTLAIGPWPADLTGQAIAFEADGYAQEYTIDDQSGSVLTLATAPPTVGATKWVIRGYAKDERVKLDAYSMVFEIMGPTQASAVGESGANA